MRRVAIALLAFVGAAEAFVAPQPTAAPLTNASRDRRDISINASPDDRAFAPRIARVVVSDTSTHAHPNAHPASATHRALASIRAVANVRAMTAGSVELNMITHSDRPSRSVT